MKFKRFPGLEEKFLNQGCFKATQTMKKKKKNKIRDRWVEDSEPLPGVKRKKIKYLHHHKKFGQKN